MVAGFGFGKAVSVFIFLIDAAKAKFNLKTSTVVLIGAGAYLLWPWIKRGVGAAAIDVSFDAVKNFRLNGTNATVDFSLNIHNPSSADYELQGISMDLLVRGQKIGFISYNNPVAINPHTITKISVPLTLSLLDTAADIINALKGGIGNFNLTLSGYATVNSLPINFSIPIWL